MLKSGAVSTESVLCSFLQSKYRPMAACMPSWERQSILFQRQLPQGREMALDAAAVGAKK
jgi:hypothetical protein